MRVPPVAQVCTGLLASLLVLAAGCSNPPSQTLDSLTVSASPATVAVGGASVLKAMAHLSDGTTQDVSAGTTWTSSNTGLATVSNGTLTAKAQGTVTVQAAYVVAATSSGSSNAAAPQNLSASTQITITPTDSPTALNVPVITWAAPAAVTYGTALSATQLNATANVAGAFAYTPASGTVLKAGKQSLSVTFTPSDTTTYSSATASVQMTVNQGTPTITWPAPAPITAGTALSATQLDATSSVPGSFIYSPAAGTVLTAGAQQLSAVFTPTDATDYSSPTAHVSLTVNAAPSNPPSPPPPANPPSNPIGGPVAPTGCGGPTINLNSGMSQSTIQTTINGAAKCSLIVFAAGTYNISGGLNIPCANSLTLTGPAANPPTANLVQSAANVATFNLSNCTGVTIAYLHFQNGQGIYVGQTDNSNITIEGNSFTNLQGTQAVYLDGFLAPTVTNGVIHNVDSNIVVEYNSFGDIGSCTTEIASTSDLGGNCGGFQTHTGELNGLTVEYNYFYHLEEPIHLIQDTTYNPGATNGVCVNCVVDYNYILNYHRIAVEIQQAIPNTGAGFEFSHNAVVDPLNPFYGTFAVSLACCTGAGFVQGDNQSAMPGAITNDDLLISTLGPGVPPYAFEWWGDQATSDGSMIEGHFSNGFAYGYGIGPRTISNAYICGPNFSTSGGYVVAEGYSPAYAVPPIQTNVVTSATCASKASTAPVINQSSSGVTLTDSAANTSIYYTTDGSTPTTSSTLYTGAFTPSAGATIQAIAMWGVAPQPTSYESGYGYTPSSVVTATYGSVIKAPTANVKSGRSTITQAAAESAVPGGAATTFPVQSVTIAPSAAAVTIGGSTQLKAIATFADGSVKDVTSAFNWQSSDPRTVSANESGLVAGLASGKSVVSGNYQGYAAAAKVTSTIGDLDWGGSLVITQGGTYTGNWQSTDAKTPAVTIATTQPVVIENAHLRSAGDLIRTTIGGANITVRNSLGVALNSGAKGQPNGVFLEVNSPARLDVENNYI
ncbi:MAG: Ig-like domain-containing protein, partial [Acidobacteriaceae bacterium]